MSDGWVSHSAMYRYLTRSGWSLRVVAYATRDSFPVAAHHTLIIPRRHVVDYSGSKQPEINAINRLLTEQKEIIAEARSTIEGFNVGMNCGERRAVVFIAMCI